MVLDMPPEDRDYISVYEILNSSIADLVKGRDDEGLNRVSYYKSKLEGYEFSTVVIDDYPIEIACDVFTRINTGGKPLTLFEIMVAKTFDPEKGFDLEKRYRELISSETADKDLESAKWDTIPRETILQCVAAIACGSIQRKDVLKISRDDFIHYWDKMKDGLFKAVDYLRSHVGVRVSRILPYNTLLIPIAWFFFHKGGSDVLPSENERLRQYFYWAALNNRFNSGQGTKVGSDLEKMQAILDGHEPEYNGHELDISAEDLMSRPFSVGDAYCMAIVCLLCEKEPRRFNTKGKVNLDNDWLKIASSKNYHHFFPRAFLKKKTDYENLPNSIVNIVLIDDLLNKRTIHAKPPSQYMMEFQKMNSKLPKIMKTHFIHLDGWGIFEDDYDRFVHKRAKAIAKALNNVLNPKMD